MAGSESAWTTDPLMMIELIMCSLLILLFTIQLAIVCALIASKFDEKASFPSSTTHSWISKTMLLSNFRCQHSWIGDHKFSNSTSDSSQHDTASV